MTNRVISSFNSITKDMNPEEANRFTEALSQIDWTDTNDIDGLADTLKEMGFSAEVGSGSDTHNEYAAHLSVMSCRAKTEGENIALSADIEAAVSIFGEAEQKVVTSVKLGENTPARRAAWTVAYAAPGETLWDIAKRYSADPADLAAANGLKYSSPDAPDSLEGTDFLIV